MKRLVVLAVLSVSLASALAAVTVPKAAAHEIGGSSYAYRSNDLCVRVISLQSHDLTVITSGGVESERGSIGLGGFNFDCAWSFERPPGYIWLYWNLWKWSAPQGQWIVCAGAGWYKNGQPSSYMSYSRRSQNGACGPGAYGSMFDGWVLNGQWYGGGVWSGYEWL